MYYKRLIDDSLVEWSQKAVHKPLLLRGARQTGKSTAVRHLGENFDNFVEINFEKQPEYAAVFKPNLVVERIVSQLSAISGKRITPGKTLLFLDEVQECPEAIMSLRYFREDIPDLHVIAAGSLLEIALDDLPTFGVGRIHSMFMYPMTFDEFLMACGEHVLLEQRDAASFAAPLPQPLHNKLVELMRTYMMVGGMPEAVACWAETKDYLQCQEIQDDLILSYEDDFPKYKKKIEPDILRRTFRSIAIQATKKFNFSAVGGDYRASEIKKALDLLILAGIAVPVTRTDANGLPLGSEADPTLRKIMLLDSGLMLRLLKLTTGDISGITTEILTAQASELVNKGPMAEMIAGLEIRRYGNINLREELFYWTRLSKNSQAEIDYVIPLKGYVVPVEVKAGQQGGMKSLWMFMREKNLTSAIRCSLENFGSFQYTDNESNGTVRNVAILPLYALSLIQPLENSIIV